MPAADCLLLTAHHHSDLVWRRTRDGYGDVRERQILQVLDYLRAHPEFRCTFVQTEVLGDYLRRHPEHADELRGYVDAGRVELQGGVIGIPDTNIPCGEALLRNMVLGRRWMVERFAATPTIAWFMDAFGMNGQLPQLGRHAGFTALWPGRAPTLDPAVTGNAWQWEGIDGTVIPAVSAHGSLQAGTHVCNLPVAESIPQRLRTSLLALWNREGTTWGMMSTEEPMFEDVVFEIIGELAGNPARRPLVWAGPAEYLEALDTDSLPVHRGELNPEFTGCYTTHIRLKLLNRQAEAALHAAEAAGVAARVATASPWPRPAVNQLWELLCLCQFHDGICGCHVDAVYDELVDWYERIVADGAGYCRGALVRSGAVGEAGTLVFNPILGKRREAIRSAAPLVAADGSLVPGQKDGDAVVSLVELPSVGTAAFTSGGGAAAPEVFNAAEALADLAAETGEYRVHVNGDAVRIVPKFLAHEVLPASGFGAIRCREDGGDMWTESYLGTVLTAAASIERVERVERGPVFTRVRVAGHIAPSPAGYDHGCIWDGFGTLSWRKEFTFYEGLHGFDLEVELQWQGSRTEVMIEFPVGLDPLAARAVYEIPFGCVERQPYYEVAKEYDATVRLMERNEYLRAKGNWPALGWVDYADDLGGLTVANNGTPGHRCQNGVITVSLLRSPTAMSSHYHPGVTALDNGRRRYRFRCLPHEGALGPASIRLGRGLNHPPVVAEACMTAPTGALLSVDAPNIILSALKCAEDSDDIVVRLYEALGESTETAVELGFPVAEIRECDANETPGERLESLELTFRPFEIKTLLLRR